MNGHGVFLFDFLGAFFYVLDFGSVIFLSVLALFILVWELLCVCVPLVLGGYRPIFFCC